MAHSLYALCLTVRIFPNQHGNSVASLQTAIPLLKEKIKESNIDCVAFPDDGAAKRFSAMFQDMDLEIIVCGKTRGEGDQRNVVIQDGDANGKHIVIVDDLVQTGGTLFESGKARVSFSRKDGSYPFDFDCNLSLRGKGPLGFGYA